jgi:hypothetical protein
MAMYSSPAAVCRRRVHVQVTAEILDSEEVRQRPVFGRGDFAAMFTQLRRDEGQPQRLVNTLLSLSGNPLVVFNTKQSVLVQLEAPLNGTVAQGDVVGLRAGEVLLGGAETLERHQPQVRLKPSPQQHARLRLSAREDAFDEAVAGERIHQRRRRARRQNIEISARLAPAAQAADDRDIRRGGMVSQFSHECCRGVVRLGHQAAAGEPLTLFERLEDERFFLGAHPFELADATLAGCALEIIEGADLQSPVQQSDRLRADALQPQQVQDGRWKFLQQFLVICAVTGVDELADLRREILADPGNAEAIGGRQGGGRIAQMCERVRGVSVRADFERVLVLDFEEIADLGKHARDGEVIHVD